MRCRWSVYSVKSAASQAAYVITDVIVECRRRDVLYLQPNESNVLQH